MAERASFNALLAEGPEPSDVAWRSASDGIRLRVAQWPAKDARGTVLLFTGRTEYLEKYGRVIDELTADGLAVASLDWRGQGLSDRVHPDPMLGHVGVFSDYQRDVEQLVQYAEETKMPKPWYLLAHSMGGCIGLRALINGLPVDKAVFSAPMWGISVSRWVKPLSPILPPIARLFGFENAYAPGTRGISYLYETDLETNMLTTDSDHFEYMLKHVSANSKFSLGGPSIHWFDHAVREMKALEKAFRPKVKTLTFVGSNEQIVEPDAIKSIHADWADAELRIVDGARHEMMMEAPKFRTQFMDGARAFLRA